MHLHRKRELKRIFSIFQEALKMSMMQHNKYPLVYLQHGRRKKDEKCFFSFTLSTL